ncbi:MAG TPA: DUF4388 domain-containing protein [Myxococcota bacterium]|nr:DUF4388 domain-containing protein [Myxococcota bacterium]
MSLVGSLEDLGLVDILQIVSLSRKSGMLMLRSESGDGRIVLRDGLVQGAAIKGEPEDLRSLLLAKGWVDAQGFDRARSLAADGSVALDEALARECALPPDRLASLRREHVERSVIRMFGWRSGEFSFEIREDLSAQDRELLLPSGLNTQYLAIEATRLGDEEMQQGADAAAARDADVEEPVFSGEESTGATEPTSGPAPLPTAAVDAVALGAARRAEPVGEFGDPAPEVAPSREPADVEIAGPAVGPTQVAVSVLPEPVATNGCLVAIDSDLSSLEWLKASLDGLCRRVHIFQHRDPAFDRIRHYLTRGITPTVVLSEDMRDRRDPRAPSFMRRLRAIAPAMPILALRPEHRGESVPDGADGVVFRPNSPTADPKRWHLYRALAVRLRNDLEPWLSGEQKVTARRRAQGALARLKGVSDRLRDPSTQGEVLTLVLDFAAEMFARVAMFMVRDDVAVGMAQRGLPPTGGPDDAGMRAIELGPDAMPELFEQVLSRRVALRAAIRGPRGRALAVRIGAAIPREVYAAPIESGGRVVALVYADNLPDEKPITDPTAFEIVLHEAGLVLDRALLERALAERG